MKKVSRRNKLAAMLKEKLIRPTHCTMKRKYPETRLVHVVQRRNTSLVVVPQQEDRLQLQSTTTVLKMESIEKIRNRGRKRETWWFCIVVMEVLLTWVHFAYEHHLPLISETKSRRRRSKDYIHFQRYAVSNLFEIQLGL